MKYEFLNMVITVLTATIAITLYAARQEKKLDILGVKLDELAKGLELNRLEDIEEKKDRDIEFSKLSDLVNSLMVYVSSIAVRLGDKPFLSLIK